MLNLIKVSHKSGKDQFSEASIEDKPDCRAILMCQDGAKRYPDTTSNRNNPKGRGFRAVPHSLLWDFGCPTACGGILVILIEDKPDRWGAPPLAVGFRAHFTAIFNIDNSPFFSIIEVSSVIIPGGALSRRA